MKNRNRIVWSEGLFIKPQHFQHQQRVNESLFIEQISALGEYQFGILELQFDEQLFKSQRISISRAKGVFPDGTYFDIPHDDLQPPVLDLSDIHEVGAYTIYLGIPLLNDAVTEVDSGNQIHHRRYNSKHVLVHDVHTENGTNSEVAVAKLQPRLFHGKEDMSAYSCIPIFRIRDKSNELGIIQDDDYIPTSITVRASQILAGVLKEFSGLLEQRAIDIASRLGMPSQQGVADVAEFMMLQVLNRWFPIFDHLNHRRILHPESFYRSLLGLCGELSTFTDASRNSPKFGDYNHFDLTQSFEVAIRETRRALSIVLTPKAVSIRFAIENNIRYAVIHDKSLYTSAEFILAVSARLPLEQLQKLFIQQTKLTSMDKIRDLISVQLPGIPLIPLSAAPRQIPFHAGYTYFRLDQNSPAWADLLKSGAAIALHVAGTFPELDLQFWAIRGDD